MLSKRRLTAALGALALALLLPGSAAAAGTAARAPRLGPTPAATAPPRVRPHKPPARRPHRPRVRSKVDTVPCVADADTMCLWGGRFELAVTWTNQYDGTSGVGGAQPYTDFSGFFSFTDPANLELMVKVLIFDGVVKVFYGQLTDLQFALTVRDTVTGTTRTYANRPENCGGIDPSFLVQSATILEKRVPIETLSGNCVASDTRLCLLEDRFAVDVVWTNPFDLSSGVGHGIALSPLSGLFHFGDPRNLELLVKTLDFGDHVLLLWGALSDFAYTITVTDTVTGTVRTYDNPGGRYCGGIDPDLGPGSGTDVAEVEPNDRVSQAQVLTGPAPVIVRGAAEVTDFGELSNTSLGDDLEDLYKITLTAAGLDVTLSGLEADCDLYLIDGGVTDFLASSSQEGTRDERLSLPTLAPGTYYIAVTIYDPAPVKSATPYTMRVTGAF